MFTVSGLVRIYQVVRCKVITQTRFNDTFYYFWYKREVGNWAVVREFIFVQGRFLEDKWYDRFFESVVEVTRAEWQINYVSDSRNQECRTFFKKPSRNRIGITCDVYVVNSRVLDCIKACLFYFSFHLFYENQEWCSTVERYVALAEDIL